MAVIQVDQSKQILLRNKKPYFYLADTVWMAFQKLSVEEWKNYLRLRSRQGFNAVQVSVLPTNQAINILSFWRNSFTTLHQVNFLVETYEASENKESALMKKVGGVSYYFRAFIYYRLALFPQLENPDEHEQAPLL